MLTRREAIELALRELGHPDRLYILEKCAEQAMSPKELAVEQTRIGRIAYHVRELAKAKLLRAVRTRRNRGAIQTFYATTPKGITLLEELGLDPDAGS